MTVNQCNLDDQTEAVEDFINNLAAAIIKLLCHHYVSQKQSFFNECKESLIVNEGVLIRDFSENHSLCKMLYKGFIGIILNVLFILLYFTIKVKRMVFLAMKAFASFQNVLRQTTAMVYTFLQNLIPYIKINYLQVKKIIYFSDGCAGQYKNQYYFINLLQHEEDFGL